MATDLQVWGPFDIPHERSSNGLAKRIRNEDVQRFWSRAETAEVADKQGIYVFALRAGRGYTPWYVGKSKNSMKSEALGIYQQGLYNQPLFAAKKGTPVLLFLAPPDNKRVVPKGVVDDMETFFIQLAFIQNPELLNTQKTRLPEWTVKGVIRSGKGKTRHIERAFRKMMGM